MRLTQTYKNQKYCVDIPGAMRTENMQAIVYPCHNGSNQKFRYNRRTRTLRNVATKKCLTAYKGRIVQKRCTKSNAQKFKKHGKKWVSNTKKCLDVEGGLYGDKHTPGKLIEFACHSGKNQKF